MTLQHGVVPATSSDTSELQDWVGFAPNTDVRDGVARFVDWYISFYGRNDQA